MAGGELRLGTDSMYMGAIIDTYLPMSSINMTFTWEQTQMQNLPLNNENSTGCVRIQNDSPRNFGLTGRGERSHPNRSNFTGGETKGT